MNYWQVAAGAEGRDYHQEFLKYGIAFVGGDQQTKLISQVQLGDRVVLKVGKSKIRAAGIVVERKGCYKGNATIEGKDWLLDFDGWDLPGYCYVDWHVPPNPVVVSGLTRYTIASINKRSIRQKADKIISSYPSCHVYAEPSNVEELDDDEMLGHLINRGLRTSTADELINTIKRIRLLANYYYHQCDWKEIREHETRTFLIIPFLLSLGWSEQQLKIEYPIEGRKKIDVACFKSPLVRGADNANCTMILESKGFVEGLDYVYRQGQLYAKSFPRCKVVVTSNGYCYRAYKRNEKKNTFDERPSAHLNLLRPTKKYPRDPSIEGGLKLLEYIAPQAW